MFFRSSFFAFILGVQVLGTVSLYGMPDLARAGAPSETAMWDKPGPVAVESTHAIGDYAEGGIVFWLEPDKTHGLVAAVVDQDGGGGIKWYNNTYIWIHTFADGIYLGSVYTQKIIEAQGTGDGLYAALVASNYSVTVDGVTYGDWYLPTPCELNLMFLNKEVINNGAVEHEGTPFSAAEYWTSCDFMADLAQTQNFADGTQQSEKKQYTARVRAIRAF